MSRAKSGGGITSNKNVSVNLKPGAKGIDVIRAPGTAASPSSPLRVGGQPPLGNTIASNSTIGPGGDRTVHRSGSQGHHGQNHPKKG